MQAQGQWDQIFLVGKRGYRSIVSFGQQPSAKAAQREIPIRCETIGTPCNGSRSFTWSGVLGLK